MTPQLQVAGTLSVLAGFIGAVAFTHTAGYFVTFMTGNAERAVLGFFRGDSSLSFGAIILSLSFFLGVFVASLFRRHVWKNHPHGAALLTAFSLLVGTIFSFNIDNRAQNIYRFFDMCFVAFGTGALNSSFTKNGETSIPITYHSGTLVKLAQGIEKHISGGTLSDWFQHALMYFGFITGAALGGIASLSIKAEWLLVLATLAAFVTAAIAYRIDVGVNE